MLQDHLDLRAVREERLDGVVGIDGMRAGQCEAGHQRSLGSVFGPVTVTRNAYRARGCRRLYPADAGLNLPVDLHSHGPSRLAVIESARGSFDDAQQAIVRATGQLIGKRQLERLARDGAVDFAGFYAQRQHPSAAGEDARVQVISCDGKGIVMRPGALRGPTQRQAEHAKHKLKTRLSRGEKRNRKRMAEVGALYEITPAPRTCGDILPSGDADPDRPAPAPAPVARRKWLTASVSRDAASVIADLFDEAQRRDPDDKRQWIALVDGNNHQIDRL